MHKKLSASLGLIIFMFGFLKFFAPFKAWYSIQIQTSGLSGNSYYFGIIGEILIGLVLLLSVAIRKESLKFQLSGIGSLGLVGVMGVAIYVHLVPEVPAEVLPLGLKSPVIPLLFLFAGGHNLYLSIIGSRSLRRVRA